MRRPPCAIAAPRRDGLSSAPMPAPLPSDATDEALFAAYAAGDQRAFQALFARYGPLVTRLVRRRVFDPTDAGDLVQQTFFQLHRARHDFRIDGKLRPWLLTIAMNVVRQYFRRRKRATEVPLHEDGSWMPSTGPHDPVAAERARQLRAALARLPDKQRVAIELHWLEGIPFPEVADIVGASVSAVKVRAHRGYARLRTLLEEMGCNQLEPSRTTPGEVPA